MKLIHSKRQLSLIRYKTTKRSARVIFFNYHKNFSVKFCGLAFSNFFARKNFHSLTILFESSNSFFVNTFATKLESLKEI